MVRSALRLECEVSFGEQEVLNLLGVNCLRFIPGRGCRVCSARTISSAPEWKYVHVRRYLNYLEASIDRSMQWAAFEPNGERLWASICKTITSFLYNEWCKGVLVGATGPSILARSNRHGQNGSLRYLQPRRQFRRC